MTLREFWRFATNLLGVLWMLILIGHFTNDQPRLELWEVLVRLLGGSVFYFFMCKLLAWIASDLLEE